ncbi:MAG: insulinase family protein, partial [Candidatus Magasanikbacteria bacterium]|nr:insulinase family protein [Candidatus Magasanikbacteria bacterium]
MYSKHTLKNGIRVVLVPRKDTETITLEVGVRVGSRYEPLKINGVSHYAEHLMFKGTKKHPTTLDISKALDSVGAEYNAFTSKDQTGYYVKTDRSNLILALDILSDMLINSKFDPTEMEREKKVIVEEINMYEDNPAMYVDDIFEQLIYKGNSLGWQISGTRKSLTGIPREDFLKFVEEHYRGEKMVVCVAGNIPENALQLVEKYLSPINGDLKNVLPESSQDFGFKKFTTTQKKPQVTIKYKDTEQVQLALGVPTYSDFDPKNYALTLM